MTTRLGFVGYGRFGRALLEIFEERGYPVTAFDPVAEIPETARATSLEALTKRSDVILVAVPVPAMRDTFVALKPSVGPSQIVVDVGSVKVGPSREMAAVFGDAQPWVACHPLFGPVSLARAEPGLRAVICPNAQHRDAVDFIADLFADIGCKVIFMEAEAHDRMMAQTHAMAFFIAKAMLDAETPTDSEAAPPSFQAMARTIESVRGDAGHLLTTIHRENPYAAEYRRRLIATLSDLDRKLNESAADVPATSDELTIAAPATPALSETRDRIDEVDQEIMGMLHRRADLVRRASHAKAAMGRGVVDPIREAAMLKVREAWASDVGMDERGVRQVFEAIIALSCEIQSREG